MGHVKQSRNQAEISQKQQKSLRQSLKDMFQTFRRSPEPLNSTLGSGILRRSQATRFDAPSTTTLMSIAEDFTTSSRIPNRFDSRTHITDHGHSARKSLLPQTSLSHLNLSQGLEKPPRGPRHPVRNAMSPCVMSVASHQASFASFSSLSTFPSMSTLRIRDSLQALHEHEMPELSDRSALPDALKYSDNHVSWLQSPTESSVSIMDSPRARSHCAEKLSDSRSIEHFRSFCVLDTAVAGCPVVATSRELRYIFDIGEHFFLNNSECEGVKSMDIVTGHDANGELITHLVLFSPLVIPSSGRSRFTVACLVDVTNFINEAASLPELDHTTDTSTIESDEAITPKQHRRVRMGWTARSGSYDLSANDLLGGCMLPDDRNTKDHDTSIPDDIWLNLAVEERRSTLRNKRFTKPKFNQTPPVSQCPSSTASSVDNVLDEFMSGLQELYSEFFLLGKSPLDDTYFEICNVSPLLHASKEYINGHLSQNEPQRLAELSARLAQGSAFYLRVQWGQDGRDKMLYCTPLHTRDSLIWICMLVDGRLPILW